MPFYQDAQFNIRTLAPCASTFTASVGTGTGSLSVALSNFFPTFVRRTAIKTVNVMVLTAPISTVTLVNFLNGTSIFATATIGTLTAGQLVTVVPTSNNTFADLTGPTGTITGSATGTTGTGAGGYSIWFDATELYE